MKLQQKSGILLAPSITEMQTPNHRGDFQLYYQLGILYIDERLVIILFGLKQKFKT